MTSRTIAAALMRKLWHRNFMLPNYSPLNWWECDVFEVTPSGYFREYEIKTSRSDFLRDSIKTRADGWGEMGVPPKMLNKHEQLAQGDERGPSFFWYLTPVGLLQVRELPRWAGLMELADGRYNPAVVKPAPRLHFKKVNPAVLQNAKDVCYGRYHAIRAKYHEES